MRPWGNGLSHILPVARYVVIVPLEASFRDIKGSKNIHIFEPSSSTYRNTSKENRCMCKHEWKMKIHSQ